MCREHEVIVARLNRKITHRHCRKVPTLELRPMRAGVDRDPQSELGAEKQQLRIDGVFLDDVRVAAYALGILPADQRPPGLSKVGCSINVRRHVAESVPIKSDIGAAGCECARLDPAYPSVPGNTRHIADDIIPMLPAIAGQLQVAVIGTDPDEPGRHRRLADRIDRGVHLRRRIVDGDTSGLFLLLLLGIVAGQVRRDPLPALTVVARAEQKLRADVNRARLMRGQRNGGVPVEPQLGVAPEIGRTELRLDVPRLVGTHVDAADAATLVFGKDVVRIGGIGEHPEAVAVEHVFPARTGDAARICGVTYPGAVVLQAAIDVVGVGVVEADVVELRDRQIVGLPPLIRAVVGNPQSAVVPGKHVFGVGRLDEDVVHIAVHAGEPADVAEALATVLAHDEIAVGLVEAIGILRIDDEFGEVERSPYHPLALVAALPGAATVMRDQ